MSFLYPALLALLLLPLLLLILSLWSQRRRTQTWMQLVSPHHESNLITRLPAYRRGLPSILALLALCGLILALARPYNGYTEQSHENSSRNLLIALDVSRSMETRDITPSRLDEARAAAYELIDALPTDKIGLIVFSGDSHLIVPLTYDHDALKSTLAQVDRSWASYGGTNYGRVLEKAMEDFARSAPTGTNAVVIFSDGEDTVGSTVEVAEQAREKKLLVITVGVGTEAGDTIPDEKGENGLYQDAEGKHVISKLNSQSLIEFARATGGDYFTMGGGADLASFAQSATSKLDYHENEASLTKAPNDLFAYFLIPSGILLLLAILLGSEWRMPRRTSSKQSRVLTLLLLVALSLAAPRAYADSELYEQVKTALAEDQHEKVKQLITDARALDAELKEDAPLSLALGAAHLALGEQQLAREAFSQALLSEDPALQAATTYQIGKINTEHSFEQLRKLYEEAAPSAPTQGDAPPAPPKVTAEQLEKFIPQLEKDKQHFTDALLLDPLHAPSQSNLEKVDQFIEALRKEIERLKEEEKKQQNQDQQNQDQQNQDQQNKDQQNKDQQNQDQQNQDQQNKDQQNQDQQNKDQQNKDQQNQDQQNQDQQNQDQQNQDQQNQDQQNQDQQNQDQQNQDQQNQDQQNQDQQNQDQQNQDQQNQDQQNQDQQNKDQEKQNQQGKEDEKDQQDQGKDEKNQQGKEKQDERQKKSPTQEQPLEQAEEKELSEEEKKAQRARAILQMHLDEETDAPVRPIRAKRPEKDY